MIAKFLFSKRYKGNFLSRIFRKIFENKKTKKILGANLILFTFLSGVLISPISALNTYSQEEVTALPADLVEVKTTKAIRPPLDDYYISQGYWFFHKALDLVAPYGTPVYPIMEGKVEKIDSNHWAYGKSILIDHGNRIKSFYAHLSKIEVNKGEEVTQKRIIGRVGSTGRSNGAHLHLEIFDNGKRINPKDLLR